MAGITRLPRRPASLRDFEVLIFCAPSIEADAIDTLFDYHWNVRELPYDKALEDLNVYSIGAIGRHNVVLARVLDTGQASTAAAAAANCRSRFPNIKLAVLVGICGAAPFDSDGTEIVLGDVIVSDRVVQYDLGLRMADRFELRNKLLESLGIPSAEISSSSAKLEDIHAPKVLQEKMADCLDVLQAANPGLADGYPGSVCDKLFDASYPHVRNGMSCDQCGCNGPLVPRSRLKQDNPQPAIHFGLIASGNTMIESGKDRDLVARETGVVGFETEGFGAWDSFPCVIVKGVCDYADNHKTQAWQRYAATTATACMKALLYHWMSSSPSYLELHSTLNQTAGPWFLVPYPRNHGFIGREAILKKLQQQPFKSTSQARTSLIGFGGIGKTQIALEYAYWFRGTYADVSVFWVHGSSTERFQHSYTSIAQECLIPSYDNPDVDILLLVKKWLEKSRRQWLMIIDDADDTQLYFPSLQEPKNATSSTQQPYLGQYIPECSHGSILITTRNKHFGLKLAKGKPPIEIGEVNNEESARLLRASLGKQDIASGELLALAHRLEHIPLALVQAAAFIKWKMIPIGEYLRLLDESDRDLIGRLSEESETVAGGSKNSRAIADTWILSFKQIQQQHTFAGELLSLMGFFNRQAIPLKLLGFYAKEQNQGNRQDIQVQEALGILKTLSLIAVREDQSFDIHRLVQLVTQNWLARENKSKYFARQALLAISHTYPYDTYENWATYRNYLPQLYQVIKLEGIWTIDKGIKKNELLHADAEEFLEYVELVKALIGANHPETLDSMNTLAAIYSNQGRLKEAEVLQSQVIEMRQRVLGEQHPETLKSRNNLAAIYSNQGRWEEAQKLQSQVIEMRQRVLGEQHPETLKSMDILAAIHNNQGRWEEAEKLQSQVIEMRQRVLGKMHPETLKSMDILAIWYSNQGRLKEAEVLQSQVIEMRQRVLGEQHPETLKSMSNLAALNRQGRWEEADSPQMRVMAVALGNPEGISLTHTRLKALESDLGYGSAPRRTISAVPLDSNLKGSLKLPFAKPTEESTRLYGEVQSIASDTNDIESQASDETTLEEITGQAHIGVFLIEEPQFRALCEKALRTMTKSRFVENMRRLLKSFYKSLLEEARTKTERATAKLLQSQRGRLRISHQLAGHIQQEQNSILGGRNADLRVTTEAMNRIENRLALALDSSANPSEHTSVFKQDVEELSEKGSEVSDSNDSLDLDALPYTFELKAFLLKRQSFRRLRKEFMLIFLPPEMRYTLSSIPKEHIWLSQERDLSFSNRVKAWIEDRTHVRWNWWPLEPRKHKLQGNSSRLCWKCSCGANRWEEISAERHEMIEEILDLSDDNSRSTHWCRARGLRSLMKAWFRALFHILSPTLLATPPASITQGSTPLRNTALASSRKHAQPSPAIAWTQPNTQGSTEYQSTQLAVEQVEQLKSWILFGVKGAGRARVLTEIPVYSHTTDYNVVQSMKKYYRSHRGLLRLWFSVWQMEYCEFFKFSRQDDGRLFRDGKELPRDQTYQYNPRAESADAQNPPIPPHAFECLLYACDAPCNWLIPHDCVPPPESVIYLPQIPKRKSSFKADKSTPIWGFETVFCPALAHIFAYHCVMVIGPFAFWVWWLREHPDDLQNASVPATVVLGALSLFWSSAGILGNNNRPDK